MSELFGVKVAAVTRSSAKLAVRPLHPDSPPVEATPTFALMLAFDPILRSGDAAMREHEHLEEAPLAKAMEEANYFDPAWVTRRARAFVSRTKLSKGVLEVWPTHAAWIEHLRAGMAWETAAYSNGPGNKAVPLAPSEEAPASGHSTDRSEGFRVGKPKLSLHRRTVARAHVPLYGPSRYIADPILSGRATIVGALRSLVGEPVLVAYKRGLPVIGALVQPNIDDDLAWFYLYQEESNGCHGYLSVDVADVKHLGRAWLKSGSSAKKVKKRPRRR